MALAQPSPGFAGCGALASGADFPPRWEGKLRSNSPRWRDPTPGISGLRGGGGQQCRAEEGTPAPGGQSGQRLAQAFTLGVRGAENEPRGCFGWGSGVSKSRFMFPSRTGEAYIFKK